MFAGSRAKQDEQKREAEYQTDIERTKTRVERMQGLLFRMKFHYKPRGLGRRND
jgi:hypothetical protein